MRGCTFSPISINKPYFCKTGTGHIEMLIGFVMLMGAIILTFTFIQNIDNDGGKSYILNNVFVSFSEEVNSEIVSFSVKLEDALPNCIVLNLQDYPVDKYSNSKILGSEGTTKLSEKELHIDNPPQEFRVYFGNWTSGVSSFNCGLPENDYIIGPMKVENYYSFDKIQLIKEEYDSDYETLKSRMGIGALSDFSIEFTDSSISMNRAIPQNAEVYVLEYSAPVILSDGTIKTMSMVVRSW